MGAFFIKEIYGSYTNVMGLPLCEVVDVLKRIGAIDFTGGSSGINGKG
jgi:septum formation protein